MLYTNTFSTSSKYHTSHIRYYFLKMFLLCWMKVSLFSTIAGFKILSVVTSLGALLFNGAWNMGIRVIFWWFGSHTLKIIQNHWYTVEIRLCGLIWTVSHSELHKIQIIRFFFENRLRCQFAVRLLLCTVCSCV